MECWGAQGSSQGTINEIPRGAYTRGKISIVKNALFYIYVGEYKNRGLTAFANTFNGGGGITSPASDNNNHAGGGATDIRLTNGNWDNFISLKSRIMVAA